MARNKKPGDPWNQFSKKKPAGKLAKRTPKPDVKPSKALPSGKAAKALPPAKSNSPSMSGGAKPKSTAAKPTPKALPPGKPGGALTKAVRGASGLRRGVGAALLTGIVAKAGDTLTKAANPKEWERVQRELKERQANYKAPSKAERSAGTRRNAAGTRRTTGGNNTKPAVSNIPASEGTGGKAETTLKYGSGASKPSQTTPSKQTRTGSSNNTVSRAVTGKPAPKPAGKVPSSNETYRDGGKGLYQGSKEYRDKVGGSGNPLLNRLRKDMGRDASTGSKAKPKMSKPEDKSRYVASNGKPYKGPAFGSGKAEPKKPASPASPNKSEKGMTLAERMRRRRMGQ